MAEKREKKKTSPVVPGIIVAVMLAVFLIQNLFPTNLGKTCSKLMEDAASVTVTVTGTGVEDLVTGSYATDRTADIMELCSWAESKTMRNRSLADGLSAEVKSAAKYSFAIEAADGSYRSLIIDEQGYVHTGAELYSLSEPAEDVLAELLALMEGWETAEE